MLAHRAVEEGGSTPTAHIEARRVLDSELQALLGWPNGEDYARAATHFEQLGRAQDAALLRRLAAADSLIAAARAEWGQRYSARRPAPDAQMLQSMRTAGLIDFDPAAPYLGVDGAAYEPGALAVRDAEKPVLVVTGRGSTEFITDWLSFDAMAGWVASRGTTASGPLTPPPGGLGCRAWEEDQVLARLVTSPRSEWRHTAGLTADTFTTDVRYDLYQAVMAVAARYRSYTPEQVEGELRRRMATVPPHALAGYGGADGLFARAYLARLASTEVTSETAAAAASRLVREDAPARPRPPRARTPGRGAGNRRDQAQAPVIGLELRRPPQPPGPGPATAPRP
jgi:hypothetical protein